jgi:hypothetical protein
MEMWLHRVEYWTVHGDVDARARVLARRRVLSSALL